MIFNTAPSKNCTAIYLSDSSWQQKGEKLAFICMKIQHKYLNLNCCTHYVFSLPKTVAGYSAILVFWQYCAPSPLRKPH